MQFLRRLRDSLSSEFEKVQLDYMTFEETCSQILRRIELTCIVELKIDLKTTTGPRAGNLTTMAIGILTEKKHSKMIIQHASKLFKDRKDWKTLIEGEKFKIIKDHMHDMPIVDQPGTPRQDIVARILKKFVDEDKAGAGGSSNA